MEEKRKEISNESCDIESFVSETKRIQEELSEESLARAVMDNLPPTSGLHLSKNSLDSSEMRRMNALMTCSLNYLRRIPCSGVLMALIASFFSTVSHFAIKLIPNVNSFVIVMCTCILSLLITGPVTMYNGWSYFGVKGEKVALYSRAIFGFFNVSLGFAAFTMIPLADATTIIAAAPIFVSMFAPCILGEACGLFEFITILMTIGGVLLVSKPTFLFPHDQETITEAHIRLFGSFLSLNSCITAAFCFISLRKLQKTPSMVVINMYQAFTLILCGVTLVIMYYTGLANDGIGLPVTLYDYGCVMLSAVSVVALQCALTVALKLEEANIVCLTRTSDIIISFIFQLAFLHNEVIDWKSVIGAIIVITGVSLSAIRSWLLKRPNKCDALWRILNCGFKRPRGFASV